MILGRLRMPENSLHGKNMDACAYPGCRSKVKVRGWCDRHYRNWRYHGDPGVQMTMREAIADLPDEAWDRPPPVQRRDIHASRAVRHAPWQRKPRPGWVLYCCGRCRHLQAFPPREKPAPCLACGERPARARGMCERCRQRARNGTIKLPAQWQPDEPCTLCGATDWDI